MTTAATRSLVIEKELPYPPEKIWRALTEGALLKEWLMDNDFQPVVGHKFTFRATPRPNWNGVIECEVLAVEPSTKLSYSWGWLGLGPWLSGRWSRPKAERSCAWSSLASVPIERPTIRARSMAGRSSSATWNGWSAGCNNAGIEMET